MKQEDKELLLKDLCCRLPYYTLVYLSNTMEGFDSELSTAEIEFLINNEYMVKPYLFPLSSMTDEQKKEYDSIIYRGIELHCERYYDVIDIDSFKELQEFYLKNHFDYGGLINKSLALDATNLGIYK